MKMILKAASEQGSSIVNVELKILGKAPNLDLKNVIFKANDFLPITNSGVAVSVRSNVKECCQFSLNRQHSDPKEVLSRLLNLIESEHQSYVDKYPALDFTIEKVTSKDYEEGW